MLGHRRKMPVMESRDLVSVSRRISRPVFWSLEGLRSRLGLEGFQSRSRALRLETLHRLFFMNFCKKELLQKQYLKMIVQNSAVQRDHWLSFLFCYVICEMEKRIFPLVKCFSKWAESPPWGQFWMARGRKNQRGRQGAKQHEGGENAQALIDHWVIFSSLIL